jgi:hypothetical protein
MGGAPVWECGGVDVNTQHDVSIGLEPLLHFLGYLQPFFPARWQLVAIVEKLQQRWIIFLFDPIGPDCGEADEPRNSSYVFFLLMLPVTDTIEAGRPPRSASVIRSSINLSPN